MATTDMLGSFQGNSKVDANRRNTRRYRPEIDGLRAFAVVAVIINHFNKDLLPSGYLGVDIFFVISGYVITSSLAERQSKNFLEFQTAFYERRIKRLVPALVIFVLFTSVLICFFNPEPQGALGTGVRALLGLSNISLYRSFTDYFAESTELNPFTHTWSLGVEEQFYLLFPFLLWFTGFGQQKPKGARNLFFLVGVLTISSLISFIYLYQINQPAAYFLMPPRFWEMAAGCLIFIGFQKRAKIEQALENVSPLLVVVGMVVVLFLPTRAAVPATISIVVLSAVLIGCLKEGTAAYDFFTLEKFVYMGQISYSLYLWHWGVLCISRWTVGIHWWSIPFQILLIICLANLSYKWIESPFRKRSIKGAINILMILFSIFGAAFLPIKLMQKYPNLLYQGARRNQSASVHDVTIQGTSISINNCKESSWRSLKKCAITPLRPNAKSILLIGDSHASHWYPAIERLRETKGIGIYTHIAGWNPPAQTYPPLKYTQGNFTRETWDEVNSYQRAMADRFLQQSQSGDVIILGSRLGGHFKDYTGKQYYSDDWENPVSVQAAFELYLKSISQLAIKARGRGVRTILVSPIPRINTFNITLCHLEWFRPLWTVKDNCPLDNYVDINKRLKRFAKSNPEVVQFVPDGSIFLTSFKSGTYELWLDDSHLSREGALKFADLLWGLISAKHP